MKNFKYIIILLATIFLNSCYDLDRYPSDQLSSGTFWKTDVQAKEGVMGVYSELKAGYSFGIYWANDCLSDITFGYDDNVGMQSVVQNAFDANSAHVKARWQHTYEGIRVANVTIRKVQESETITEAVKKQVIAEGKFLRALLYFHLTNYFGGVPIYDEKVDYDKDYMNLQANRSSLEDVRKFILSDLTAAIADLPVKWNAEDYGRATKGAAYALRGKVYLYAKDYKNAATDFEEIVKDPNGQGYGYSLYPNYADLFKQKAHSANEMIFSIQNYLAAGFNLGMGFDHYVGNYVSFGFGWNNVLPSVTLADSYELKNGKKFNWDDFIPGYNANADNLRLKVYTSTIDDKDQTKVKAYSEYVDALKDMYAQRDPRMAQTLILPYSKYLGQYTSVPETFEYVIAKGANNGHFVCPCNFYHPRVLYLFRKFVPEGNMDGQLTKKADRDYTPINFPVIRYADVLLMLAECDNELSKPDEAVKYINMVRTRSGMPGINNGDAWMRASSKDEIFERIKHERAVELVLEGHRYNDLKRWGLLKQAMTGPIMDIVGNTLFIRQPFTDNLLLWPIPTTARDHNPNLAQNPGW